MQCDAVTFDVTVSEEGSLIFPCLSLSYSDKLRTDFSLVTKKKAITQCVVFPWHLQS